MAKVPLVPVWMKEEFDSWARPDGPEPVAPTEEECILIAEALADEWNGRCIPIEVVERQVNNRIRRERRRRLKEAQAAARLEAEARAAAQAPAPGPQEPAVPVKPATPARAPRRTRSAAAPRPGAGTRSSRAQSARIEIGRDQLGLPELSGVPRRRASAARRKDPPA